MKQDEPTVDKFKKVLSAKDEVSVQVLAPTEMQRTRGGKMLKPLFHETNTSSFCMSSLKQ